MCQHQPPCRHPDAPGREAAAAVAAHPGQGWSLLCNGIVLFEGTGLLLPGGRVIPPHRRAPRRTPPECTRPASAGPWRRFCSEALATEDAGALNPPLWPGRWCATARQPSGIGG